MKYLKPIRFLILIFLFFSTCEPSYGQMTDKEFFSRINLAYPGLENVRKAVERNDFNTAITEYAIYHKNRKYPSGWHRNSLSSNYPSRNRVSTKHKAELTLKNQFKYFNVSYQFNQGQINWQFNPTDKAQNPNYKGSFLKEWTVSFNRFQFFWDLASAFHSTGNPIYAAKVDELVNHWIDNAPFEIPPREKRFSSSWRTLEAGIRIGGAWAGAWVKTIRSDEFKNSTVTKWAKSWMQHGDYLSEHSGTLNWLTTESVGLYTIGMIFPEFKDVPAWQRLAQDRLLGQSESDFYPDAVHMEITPHYHRISAKAFADLIKLAKLDNKPVDPNLEKKVHDMYDYLLKIMQPDRNVPRVNDTKYDENYVKAIASSSLTELIDRRDNKWLISEGSQGAPPTFNSVKVPWAGQVVFRDNWTKEGNYLMFEYGPFGEGTHQHEDKLGVHIAGYGDVFVFETGREDYGSTNKRKYSLSSQAHSIITIDNLSQNRKGAAPKFHKTDQPYEVVFTDTDQFNYTNGSYRGDAGEQYGLNSKLEHKGDWKRHILYLKPDVFLLLDVLNPKDNNSHTYHSHFHLNANRSPEFNKSSQQLVINEANRPHFSITPLNTDNLKTEVITGSTSPYLGWEMYSGKADRKIPTVRFEKKGAGNTNFAYVFKATPEGKTPLLPKINLLNTAEAYFGVEVSNSTGKNDVFQVLVVKDETTKFIEWDDKFYEASAILMKDNVVYDLYTGEPINEAAEKPDDGENGGSGGSGSGEGGGSSGGSGGGVGSGGSSSCQGTDLLSSTKEFMSTVQSSMVLNGLSSLAVDKNDNTSAITDKEIDPWWSLDLGVDCELIALSLFKSKYCYDNDITDYYVFLSATPFSSNDIDQTINQPGVYAIKGSSDDIFNTSLLSNTTMANVRYIRLHALGNGSLNFDEIEVLGCMNNDAERPEPRTEIWLEAECGELGNVWEKYSDDTASEEMSVTTVPNLGGDFINNPPTSKEFSITYRFNIEKDGVYKIHVRALATSSRDNSYWLKVNTGKWMYSNIFRRTTPPSYTWNRLHDANTPYKSYFKKGSHQITIAVREIGLKIDKILLTSTSYNPTDLGDEAFNCVGALQGLSETPVSVDAPKTSTTFTKSGITIKPASNPFSNGLRLFVNAKNRDANQVAKVFVYDLFGKMVYQQDQVPLNQDINLPNLDYLQAGTYLVKLITKDQHITIPVLKQNE